MDSPFYLYKAQISLLKIETSTRCICCNKIISFTSEDQKIGLYIFYYAEQVTDLKLNADRNLIDCNMIWVNQINPASGRDLYASEEINLIFSRSFSRQNPIFYSVILYAFKTYSFCFLISFSMIIVFRYQICLSNINMKKQFRVYR